MIDRPYYLPGRSRLARLQTEVHTALLPLLQRWWSQPVELTVDIENFSSAAALPIDELRGFAQQEETWLALLGSERNCLALAEGWLGCRVAASSELVLSLLRTFCGELFAALAGSDAETSRGSAPALESRPTWSHLPANFAQPGAGALVLNIAIGDTTFTLLTSAALWPALATPTARRSASKLTPCNQALGACRVDIEAMLPAVRLPLAGIAALATGDFLNLGHDLSGIVELRSNAATIGLSATVGRQTRLKAVRLSGDR
jgi:hypothetical protein